MKPIVDMLNGTADGAMLADEGGIVVLWNRAAERLLGFRADEVLGRSCHDVMRGETLGGQPFCSPLCAIGHRLGCGNAVRNFDIQTHTKAGKVIWLNVSSLPVPSRKKGRFLFAHLFRDITKQAKVSRLVGELHAALSHQADQAGVETKPAAPSAASSSEGLPEISSTLPLSEREREVLYQLASGKNTKHIADALCISPATVRNHVQHILEKLGAHNRLEMLVIAFHHRSASS